jgi:hypothetical protein
MSAAGAVAVAAPVVDGAGAVGDPGTAAGGLGGSSEDGVPNIAHHTTNANATAAITLIKSKSMVASTHAKYTTRHSGKSSKRKLRCRSAIFGAAGQRDGSPG